MNDTPSRQEAIKNKYKQLAAESALEQAKADADTHNMNNIERATDLKARSEASKQAEADRLERMGLVDNPTPAQMSRAISDTKAKNEAEVMVNQAQQQELAQLNAQQQQQQQMDPAQEQQQSFDQDVDQRMAQAKAATEQSMQQPQGGQQQVAGLS